MLGEMAAELNGDIQVAERCVVIGWEAWPRWTQTLHGNGPLLESGDCRAWLAQRGSRCQTGIPRSVEEALLASIEPARNTDNERPASITVIAWTLILTALVSSVISTLTLNHPVVREPMNQNPLPLAFQYCLLYGGLLVQLVSGAAMLRAQNWARIL